MRGRKPKPTALRILEGMAGHRPVPTDEPQPPAVETLPTPPRRLGPIGRAEWRAQVAVLTGTRVLTVSDLTALEQVCATAEELHGLRAWLRRAQRAQRAKKPDWDLVLRLHAAIDRKQKLAETLQADFGLNPSARSRIKTEKSPGITDPLGAFQKARRVSSPA